MSKFINPGVVVTAPINNTIASPLTKTVIEEPLVIEIYRNVFKKRWTAKSAYRRYLNDLKTFESMCKMYPERVSKI